MIGVERALCRSVPRALNSDKRNLLLRSGLLTYIKDGVDTIGLSIADKVNVRTELWSLFFDENDDPYSDEARITAIEASGLTNSGLELVWNPLKGGALYAEGTSESILRRAYRYFDVAWPEIDQAVNPDLSPAYNPDDSPMYNPA